MIAELTRRAVEEYEAPEKQLDYVVEWVEGGKTIVELAKDMSETNPERVDIEPRWITRYLIEKYGKDEYDQRMDAARKEGSYAMVEDAREIADDESLNDRDKIARAKLRIEQRHWTAERFNKRLASSRNDVNVNVSINQLHLNALRVRQARATARLTSENGGSETVTPARAFIKGEGEPVVEADVIECVIPQEGESA